MITILAIGKKHEPWIIDGLERYQKRLRQPFNIDWVLLPHSALTANAARLEESQRILKRLNTDAYIVLLDETGKQLDSPAFSGLLAKQFVNGREVVVVIGGAYGVTDEIHQRANYVMSLSKLVFPHQLVRLLLVEQLYRTQEIANGSPYHHQ